MKNRLRSLLEEGQIDQAAGLVAGKKRLFGTLLSFTFDSDSLVAWRAVEAMGMASDRIAEDNPDYVLSQLRRLHWLLSEEAGGICLFAPPAMAEIIRRRPEMFSDFIPLVVSLLVTMAEEDLEHFRPNVLWALGRLAPAAGDEVESVVPAVVSALDDPQPIVRGTAVWCLGQAGKRKLLDVKTNLLSDGATAEIYMDGNFKRARISEFTREILSSKA
jgi:hypothetical protein